MNTPTPPAQDEREQLAQIIREIAYGRSHSKAAMNAIVTLVTGAILSAGFRRAPAPAVDREEHEAVETARNLLRKISVAQPNAFEVLKSAANKSAWQLSEVLSHLGQSGQWRGIESAQWAEIVRLMDDADEHLDKPLYAQHRHQDFNAPDDAECTITFGVVRKINALFKAIDKLRPSPPQVGKEQG